MPGQEADRKRHLDAELIRRQIRSMSGMSPPSPPRLTETYPQMPPAACRAALATLLAAGNDEARAAAIAGLLEHQPVLNYSYETGQTFWRARRLEGDKRYLHEREMLMSLRWPRLRRLWMEVAGFRWWSAG
jgi:hypothetical protein